MVDTLIKKVILYNDKIEIYYNYTNGTNPDGTADHRGFIFYTCKKSFSLDRWTFDKQPIILDFDIILSAWFFPLEKPQPNAIYQVQLGLVLAPQVGFEPTTPRLTAECYYRWATEDYQKRTDNCIYESGCEDRD